jgi:23S rRNA (uracil1939-C5)-methyltransferase
MDYRAQLQAKSEQLRAALSRQLEHRPDDVTVTGLGDHDRDRAAPFGFRTKLLMAAAGPAGGLRLGFYRLGTLELVPAEGCPVQHPQALAVLSTVRQILDAHGVGASTSIEGRSSRGWLHALGVRVDPPTASSELVLCGRSTRVPRGAALIDQLSRVPTVRAVHLSASAQRSSYPAEPPFKRLAGGRRIPFSLAGERFSLGPGTFFQTSARGAELLARQVLSVLPEQIDCLVDLYAGAGLFALFARDRWRRAVAVESSSLAVADLRHHLRQHPAEGLSVVGDRVESCIERVLHRCRAEDVVLLDPPRRGCRPEVIAALLRCRPPTVIYISCGFPALLEQGRRLVEGGYSVTTASAVDMFPHTAHLEVVVRFDAKRT